MDTTKIISAMDEAIHAASGDDWHGQLRIGLVAALREMARQERSGPVSNPLPAVTYECAADEIERKELKP